MSSLVPVGDGPLSERVTAEQVRQLRSAADYVRSCPDEAEVLNAKRQAEMVRHWARINKGAAEIALEACRLQATALRRLCQLSASSVDNQERTAGLWLATLGDPEFGALMDGMRYAKNPVTLYKDHLKKLERDATYQRGRDIASGDDCTPADYELVSRAANEVLHAALAGGAITVNELSEELADIIGFMPRDLKDDYTLKQGIESIIREALRNETFSDEDHPDFITWKDAEAGWLRIPWAAGSLTQLRWMASFRQEQARELKAAADDLTALADAMEQAARRHGLTRLNDIWQALTGASARDAALCPGTGGCLS